MNNEEILKKPEDCEGCGFNTRELTFYKGQTVSDMDCWFCKLCANTPTGNAHRYPGVQREAGDVLATVCYIGNEILKELKKKS